MRTSNPEPLGTEMGHSRASRCHVRCLATVSGRMVRFWVRVGGSCPLVVPAQLTSPPAQPPPSSPGQVWWRLGGYTSWKGHSIPIRTPTSPTSHHTPELATV